MNKLTLHQLTKDKEGTVVEINGGYGLNKKLNDLGIRKGKKITKISDSFIKGPITVKIDNSKVAIGHGMAEKIILEADC